VNATAADRCLGHLCLTLPRVRGFAGSSTVGTARTLASLVDQTVDHDQMIA
jgi:hypothetical protein